MGHVYSYHLTVSCGLTGLRGTYVCEAASFYDKVYYFSSFKDFNTISPACHSLRFGE